MMPEKYHRSTTNVLDALPGTPMLLREGTHGGKAALLTRPIRRAFLRIIQAHRAPFQPLLADADWLPVKFLPLGSARKNRHMARCTVLRLRKIPGYEAEYASSKSGSSFKFSPKARARLAFSECLTNCEFESPRRLSNRQWSTGGWAVIRFIDAARIKRKY
jgi:hypothetical protein